MNRNREFWREFLRLYMSKPILWNMSTKGYYNRWKRHEEMDELVDLCRTVYPEVSREFVQKKINLFRDAFRKEYRKVLRSKKSGAAPEDVYSPVLWYYDVLLPLKEQKGYINEKEDKGNDSLQVSFFYVRCCNFNL